MKSYLCVPYICKEEVKQNGGKWDAEIRRWYIEGNIPDELIKYTPKKIVIDYEDIEIQKTRFKSLFWNKNEKFWYCSEEEYEKYQK